MITDQSGSSHAASHLGVLSSNYLIKQIDSDIIEKGDVPPVVAVLFVDGFLRRFQQAPQPHALVNIGLRDDNDLPRGIVLVLFVFLVLLRVASC